MTTFVFCRGCAHQIHETAQACPKCGTPQPSAVVPPPQPPTPTVGSVQKTDVPTSYTSYDQVPWFRKRWFAIICLLIFMPVFLAIAYTGDVYYEKKGQLKTFPKSTRIIFTVIFVLWVLTRFMK
jgi:hypothetical protein